MPFGSFVQHHREQYIVQCDPIALFEQFGDHLFPWVDSISEIREGEGHRRGFVGKGRSKERSELFVEVGRILFMGQFDETFGYLGHQQAGVAGYDTAALRSGLKAGVKRRSGDLCDHPLAFRDAPSEGVTGEVGRKVHRFIVA